ncbi:hypothetical protein [Chlamydiifrater phoenicopteri]|uniref:hypothetical protein n=1 Tax=Chlamydiifrater phoenicopteri TaxID=2681469 RepID=UPI001BCFAFE4|nr:hypothetical protein [Chlamydiifrater phoenicopteri]
MSFGQIVRSNLLESLPEKFQPLPEVYGIQRRKVEGDRLALFVASIIVVLGAIIAMASAHSFGVAGSSLASLGISLGFFSCVGAVVYLSKRAFSRIRSFQTVNSFLRKNHCKFSHSDRQSKISLSLIVPTISDYILTQKVAWLHPLFPCRVILAATSVVLGVGLLMAGVYALAAFPSCFLSGSIALMGFSFLSSSFVLAGLAAFRAHFLLAEGVSVLQMLYLSNYLLPKSAKNFYKEKEEELNVLRLQLSRESLSKEKVLRRKNLAEFRLKKLEKDFQEYLHSGAPCREGVEQSLKSEDSAIETIKNKLKKSDVKSYKNLEEESASEAYSPVVLTSSEGFPKDIESAEGKVVSEVLSSLDLDQVSRGIKVFQLKIKSQASLQKLSFKKNKNEPLSQTPFSPKDKAILTGVALFCLSIQKVYSGVLELKTKFLLLSRGNKVEQLNSFLRESSKAINQLALEIFEEEKRNKEASFSWLMFRLVGSKALKRFL